MKRALITGNAGFLGRHFTAALNAREDWSAYGFDLRSGFPATSRDCRDYFESTANAGDQVYYDLVVHCAAEIGGRAVIDGSPLETAVNLELDAAMFRWAAKARPGHVLYISSSAAYPVIYQGQHGGHRSGPLVERDVSLERLRAPDQVYGWSKVVGEVLAEKLREAGVPVTVVRPFSGYGGDQSPDYPFRAILDRVKRREDPLTIWSDSVRDFIHVSDLVAGALAIAGTGADLPVNLCTGVATSFSQLARLMVQVVQETDPSYDPEIAVLHGKPAGVAYRVGDPSLMETVYMPAIGMLDGVRMALEGTG